jgi:Ca2+-binding RTX toxin-like protein
VLVGTPGDDVIAAGAGDDTVRGLGGDDVLCGGAGTDHLDGGDGDDHLVGGRNGLQQPYPDNPPDNVGDTLVGGPGDDLLDPGYDVETDADGGFLPDTISYADAPAGVRVDLGAGTATGGAGTDTLVLEGRVELEGSAYDDVLVSGEYGDSIYAGAGDDVLRGGPGRDYLQADPSDLPAPGEAPYDDRVYGGPGGDGIYLANGDDLARGGSGDDTISHGWGASDLRGGVGDDDLETQLDWAGGATHVDGGSGEDQCYAWSVSRHGRRVVDVEGRMDLGSGDVVFGPGRTAYVASIETLRIPDGSWTVLGTAADETFFGGDLRRDRIVVRARGGDDHVTGTPGADRLNGGAGRDVVGYVGPGDVVTGFEVTQH